ncbi:hypothetical protein [Photobacterium leiognathi]|uniref:hypothetical protein n=1 Tax=Photobacterium leiognathi TaxID=553611 RepID=UPI0029811951|nr:hypothetical protein [Photobacterium leiognathi]
MEKLLFEELETYKLNEFIAKRKTFEVVALGSCMDKAVKIVEKKIEDNGLTCRVYLYGRVAAAGASVFGGVTGLLGIASAVGMAAHNLATYNPDYEIAKHKIDNKLTVIFKK